MAECGRWPVVRPPMSLRSVPSSTWCVEAYERQTSLVICSVAGSAHFWQERGKATTSARWRVRACARSATTLPQGK